MGTPLFMSPEACRGEEIGHAGDLYSLGVSWWFMLTGQYPFQAANLHGLLFKHISDPLPPPTGLFDNVPEPIVKLVYQCLEKDAAKRPASALRLVEAIEALPAQGLLIPRDARELIGAGSHSTIAGGGTTAATAVAGKIDRTAATIIGGAQQAATAAPPANRTMAADLSPQGAVAATVVANLNTAQPQATAAAAPAPAKKSGAGLAIAAVVAVLVLGGAGAWFALRPAPPAPAPAPTPTPVATVQPPKPDLAVVPAPIPLPVQPASSNAALPTANTTPVADPPKPVEAPKPVVAAVAPPTDPPKPVEEPKPAVAAVVAPPVEPVKPVEPPKPVDPPKPVEAPKPIEAPAPVEAKPVEPPKPEPPKAIDTSAFDTALSARDWKAAKSAANALPEPARTDATQKLTKAANAQLVATMRAAQPIFKEGKFAESAAMLAKDMGTVEYADKQIRDTFVSLAKSIRQAAKEAQENP